MTESTLGVARAAPLPDRGLIGVGGVDARGFLQNLVTNDLRRLTPRRPLYALLLTPQGKFLHDFFVMELPDADADTAFALDCERHRRADLLRRLAFYKLRSEVVLADLTDRYAVHAAFGQGASAALGLTSEPAAQTAGGGVMFVDPRLSDLGARMVCPGGEDGSWPGLRRATLDEYREHRLSLGIADGSRDLVVERTFPLEAGLDDLNAIDFSKGCYVGQELTTRTRHRGTIRKRLLPVFVEGPLPRPGTAVTLEDRQIGEIRSGRGRRALAMLRLEVLEAFHRAGIDLTAGGSTIRPYRPAWMRSWGPFPAPIPSAAP